jgi:copper transport protein
VRHLDALTSTAFGRSVLIKAALLLALGALAAVNRRRVVPALTRIAARGESPAATGVLLRRTLRGEVALLAVVLGVTAALVSYAPPVSLARGPFSATKRMGPVEADVTVDPATVGANRLHVYLFYARTGAQFDRTEELIVTVSQPHRAIGSIDVTMRKAGPGHYVSDGLLLVPGGEWDVEIIDRVSDFDEYTTTVQVPVRR